ncbi:hypothetical protein GCM10009584_27200 [Ornithinimicrobium humiphilum]|uniref:Subtilisin family serine protease n=1 Tax=Ornithinimicrobium humiphilum TaxID=125288 RepID=A0A543KP63_9MICO|nr:cell wall-binding repeat-containing protein [Ornithinimicrobium humiphilum]TQM96860.1 subtilisin family serine protease [Ornithinimicrobium humiphilum]
MTRPITGGRRRGAVLGRTLAVLCAATLVTGAASAAPLADPTAEARAKIRPDVTAELKGGERPTVLVRFAERPDLTALAEIDDWAERGRAVHRALVDTAEESQAEVRELLEAEGLDYTSFFITNALAVPGDPDLLTEIARDPEVEGVYLQASYEAPEPTVEPAALAPAAAAWGVADINADDVWAQHGVTGEGIVVGSIDTGVEHTHPALRRQYRGTQPDGSFSHDYSWFDTSTARATSPWDGDGHGTHVAGIMVGDDGAGAQIGVAPGARWIASNGCCASEVTLLASAQWMLAPTTRTGTQPRPDLRPHVVNNSWGTTGPSTSPFLVDVTRAWEAAGIFAVFSNGNFGNRCQTSSSPGSLRANYSVGAYGADHSISLLSSRGAGEGGETKPNIAAPGVAVVSSVPGDGYATSSGTSMAAPHVSGAVALLWSAAPELLGDVQATRRLLDGSAVDSPDLQCGGTPGDNNVFGEGRLDALALLQTAGVGRRDLLRVSGPDRYRTSAAVAARFPAGVDTVVVAAGHDFPDALAGAARAGGTGGPVLLSRPGSLPAEIATQLARLDPARVVLAGSPDVLSTVVEQQVRTLLPTAEVVRRAGVDRYATAAAIAADVPTATRVVVAGGTTYPDALAGAALAADTGSPLLLVRPTGVPAVTLAQLERLAPTEIVVLGGPGAVSEDVVARLRSLDPAPLVRRISGGDRYATAAAAAEDRGTTSTDLVLAGGQAFPDALSGAALAGATGAPLLLTRQDLLPSATAQALGRLDPGRVVVLGGELAVGRTVLQRVRQLP